MIRVDQLLEEVQLLHRQGRYQKMIALLNDAILEDDTYAELYFHRGVAWFSSKTYDTAIEDFTKAIGLRPDYFRAWLNRGVCWSLKQQPNKAIPDLTKAMEIRPGHAGPYQYLGTAWNGKKDYDTALGYFDKAIELNPDNAELYFHRGIAWSGKKEYENAIEDYRKAIALQPDYSSAYTSLGDALYKKEEYGKALQYFARSIGIKPDNKRAYYGLGRLYEALKEFELASIHYKRAYYLGLDGALLVEVFRDKFPSPFIVKNILPDKNGSNAPEASFSTIEWLMNSCGNWTGFLDHLRNKNYPATQPERYYSLEAMVNYYMGNSPAAYRIFDTQFESDAHPYPLTLRDQYYLALSAMDFKEPDDGLSYALGQAGKPEDRKDVDNYYAGQLYLLHNDLNSALWNFQRAGDFLPALYGKMAVYGALGNTTGSLQTAERIADREAGGEISFLEGISPLIIDPGMSFEEMFSRILGHIHYYELTEEIERARDLLHRTASRRDPGFSAMLDFSGRL